MARTHQIVPQGNIEDVFTVRLGAGNLTTDNLTSVDSGKLVKLVAESRYDLCAAGNEIEGVVNSVELATTGGYTIAGLTDETKIFYAVADGLQATPGTGTIAIGDYCVAGTITAKGTALTSYPKVCKATGAGTTLNFKWRVVSLGTVGTGAVGTTIVLKKV
jgi:hypothetical protein